MAVAFPAQPLLAVGIEGAWGVVLCLAALPLLSLVKTSGGQPLDDAGAAFRALWEVPKLRYSVRGLGAVVGGAWVRWTTPAPPSVRCGRCPSCATRCVAPWPRVGGVWDWLEGAGG